MKTLNEWLDTGLLYGLEEEDYPRIVKIFNKVFIYAESVTSVLSNKFDRVETYIFPLLRRVYSYLKGVSEEKNIPFNEIVDYIDAHEILALLINKQYMLELLRIAFPSVDSGPRFLGLMSEDIVNNYIKSYEHIKEVKTEEEKNINEYTNFPFRLWNKLNKKTKNETESPIETPLPDQWPNENGAGGN